MEPVSGAQRELDDLVTAAAANAPWAFERLYERLAPAVTGYLRLRGARDPEDLTNEVMLGVFRGLPGFEGDGTKFRSWVFTIAHRRLIDDHRRRTARVETSELDPIADPAGGDVEVEAVEQLMSDRVAAILGELTDDQREVIVLRVIADLSVEQVAEVLGKQPGAVKMLQRRGLTRLRRILGEGVT